MAFAQISIKVQGKKHKKEVRFEVTNDLAKETMSILHATAHSILRDLDRRFVNTSVVNDLIAIFQPGLHYDKIKDYPQKSLENVSKDFLVNHDQLERAWKELHMLKDVEMVKHCDSKGKPRDAVQMSDIWPQVVSCIDEQSAPKVAAAKPALELLLMLEATNCGVERDAGMKRSLKDVMHGNGKSETVDTRLRVLIEGPALERAKGALGYNETLYEAAQQFLLTKRRHDAEHAKPRKSPGNHSEEHKEKLSKAATSTSLGHNDEQPSGIRMQTESTSYEVVELPDDDGAQDLFAGFSEMFQDGSMPAYPSTKKPTPKKKTGGRKAPLECVPQEPSHAADHASDDEDLAEDGEEGGGGSVTE